MSSITFSNAENIVVINAILKGGSQNYGVQLSNIKHFYVSNITFIEHGVDGVHINGPAGYGEVCNLKGENMGDDMVALNAWDWEAAAISFGTIEYVYVHDNESKNNELRLLPGRKMYENSYVDCDIRNCIIENLFGIYTFKMYNQPNIKNAKIKNYNDSSGTVGNIKNIYFKNININENRNDGFNGIPINGVYDICSNCEDIYFEDIKVDFDKEEFEKKNLSFISAGPLSVTWKNGSDNPDDWGEAFSPNDVCVVKNLHLKNITFKGNKITSAAELTKEIHLQINEDYPNTTPKGGTGYGTIENVTVE